MKYFIDTEFKEYFKQHRLFGVPIGYKTPTIDLISIGIVDEKGNSFYALNKSVDLKEVWKDEWLKDNVLLSIYKDKVSGDLRNTFDFTYRTMKWIFSTEGMDKYFIRVGIEMFINDTLPFDDKVEFYGYYADYDWVVFCQLFGRMLDLPKGFPMYCKDLKQMMDDKGLGKEWKRINCPDPEGEHNALEDARWNLKLFNAIQKEK